MEKKVKTKLKLGTGCPKRERERQMRDSRNVNNSQYQVFTSNFPHFEQV